MLVKVCGLKQVENTAAVLSLKPDLVGLILYPQSKRYAGKQIDRQVELIKASKSKLVFVTVNHNEAELNNLIRDYAPDYIQLHGDESIEYCRQIRNQRVKVIKALQVESEKSIQNASLYDDYVDTFLFDTSCKTYGGSGKSFNWGLLKHYEGSTNFILSGGISSRHLSVIKEFDHPKLLGIDINSCFEDTPGVKNIKMISHFLNHLKLK